MINQDSFSLVCNRFDLGSLEGASRLNNGFSGRCFKLTTSKSRYFVKVYAIGELKMVESAAKAESFFANSDIPVLRRLNDYNGRDHFITNKEVYVVFPYVTIPKIKKWNRELYGGFGDFLGRMHEYSIRKTLRTDDIQVFDLMGMRVSALKRMRSLMGALRRRKMISKYDELVISNLSKKTDYLKKVPLEKLSLDGTSLIHGDFHPGNLYMLGNEVKLIYDFDRHCFGSTYYEFAHVIINTCFSGSFDDKNFTRTKLFLRSYQKHVAIKENILITAIKICRFEAFSSFWAEEKWLKEPAHKLFRIMQKENRTANYFSDDDKMTNLIKRIRGFLNE